MARYGMIGQVLARAGAMVIAIGLLLAAPAGVARQKQKEKPEPQSATPIVPRGTDAEQIDYQVSEMLGAWQLGDVTLMRNSYAPNVMVVSGAYEPPIIGWDNYLAAYKRMRESYQGTMLERQNSFTTVRGNVAWVTYQWVFSGLTNGVTQYFRGHTTLVFEKQGAKWLIVHNHTSVIPEYAAPPQTPSQKPASQP